MTETPNETAARIQRSATRLYTDLTAQGDPRIAGMRNTTTYLTNKLASLAHDVAELAGALLPTDPVEAAQLSRDQLMEQSFAMKREAAERFSDRLIFWPNTNRWHTIETGQPVVFTPNGWRVETEVWNSADYDVYVQ